MGLTIFALMMNILALWVCIHRKAKAKEFITFLQQQTHMGPAWIEKAVRKQELFIRAFNILIPLNAFCAAFSIASLFGRLT